MEPMFFSPIIYYDHGKTFMNGYVPKKKLIFFNPRRPGVIFTYPAYYYITAEQLVEVQEYLSKETIHPVFFIEDRRVIARRPQANKCKQSVES